MTQLGLVMKYFVLSPLKNDAFGRASRLAIETYAEQLDSIENAQFAQDLSNWIQNIREELNVEE